MIYLYMIFQAYTEVHSTSKKLLYQLDHLVQVCNSHTSSVTNPTNNASGEDNKKHVSTLELLHIISNGDDMMT